MLKRGFVLMICAGLLASLCACGNTAAPDASAPQTTGVVETTVAPTTEPTEPDDGSIKFYYDDRIAPAEFGGTDDSAISVKSQEITSTVVGSSDLDTDILYYDKEQKQYIATGVGTATLDVDGKEVLIRVRPAPISLFMITGHSLGAGQCGKGAQSVKIEAGQAYSCHKTATFKEASADMGIGFAAPTKPAGIDAFSPNGGGTIGEGSALAWKWNQLTGEKVWVLNAAVGGSVIPEWHKGQVFYEPAVAMYRAAAQVLSNEVKAGHYVLKNTCLIYHSGANFGYKEVEYTDEIMEYWYDSMINGFREDLAMDITGDGNPETIQSIGFVPSGAASMKDDKPINYYLAATDKYPNVYILNKTVYYWRDDALLRENFPEITYETQSEPVEMPTVRSQIIAEDGVHLTQCGYNASGLLLGEALYNYYRTEHKLESYELLDENGKAVGDSINLKRRGSTEKFTLFTEPCYVSDFTIELSENLEMISPFTVKAKPAGEGFIKISYGNEVIREIAVTVGE